MRILKDLLYKAGIIDTAGSTDLAVSGVYFNSASLIPGSLFIAVKGRQSDGHHFITDAINKGATSIVCEEVPDEKPGNIVFIKVKDARAALSFIAANFYNNPSEKLKLTGITGTNGKTSVATMLFELFRKAGYKTGLISTVKNQVNEQVIPSEYTTPDPLSLNQLLNEMVEAGCTHCFMEVSSHAVVQQRVRALSFSAGIFTNISHDHLDYHKTFSGYIQAKKSFFDMLPEEAMILINSDDKNSRIMVQNAKGKIKTFSLKGMSDFKGKIVENTFSGLLLNFDGTEVACKLIGKFNAYNLLAVYAASALLGLEKMNALSIISNLHPPEGRFECIFSTNNIIGIVDYAHTPDALENVLKTINHIRTGNEKIITLTGCGGERDQAKRPLMARIACDLSDKVILTSDNPRSEDPNEIIRQMQKGVRLQHSGKVLSITDRREAVKTACSLARAGDIILLAGKGHEKYQEINGVKFPFEDLKILQESFDSIINNNKNLFNN